MTKDVLCSDMKSREQDLNLEEVLHITQQKNCTNPHKKIGSKCGKMSYNLKNRSSLHNNSRWVDMICNGPSWKIINTLKTEVARTKTNTWWNRALKEKLILEIVENDRPMNTYCHAQWVQHNAPKKMCS